MGAMWQDVESEFAELDSIARDDYLLAIAVGYEHREARRQRYESDCRVDPVKAKRRAESQGRHVKRKEALDPEFKRRRRERSRAYARELSEAREAERLDCYFARGGILPGLRVGVDIPAPARARLRGKVDEVREKQRARMRKTRADGKRRESLPLFERCA
jgi:hypothetical protein